MISPATLARDSTGLTAAAHPAAVGSLRADAAKQLAGWGLNADSVLKAELVISELLTNALKHGHAPMLVLRLALEDSMLRVEVDDPDRENWPRLKPPDPAGESGNGMRIVDQLSRWGVICHLGKTVYADIPVTYRVAS